MARFAAAVAALLVASAAAAQAPDGDNPPATRTPRPFAWVFDVGFDFGTERILEVTLANGQRHHIDANDGTYLQVGGSVLPLAGGRLRTRFTVGLDGTAIRSSSAAAELFAIPVEVLEVVTLGDHVRLGAGVHALPYQHLSTSGDLDGRDLALDPSLGLTARADLLFTLGESHLGAGVRWLVNRASSGGGPTATAHAFGFFLTFDAPTWR